MLFFANRLSSAEESGLSVKRFASAAGLKPASQAEQRARRVGRLGMFGLC